MAIPEETLMSVVMPRCVNFYDGVVQETKQVSIFMPHDLLDQRERFREIQGGAGMRP